MQSDGLQMGGFCLSMEIAQGGSVTIGSTTSSFISYTICNDEVHTFIIIQEYIAIY